MPAAGARVGAAAAIIFFSYIGFDAVSTVAEGDEESAARHAARLIYSLVGTTILYIIVAAVLTGVVPWERLGSADPLAMVLEGAPTGRGHRLVGVGDRDDLPCCSSSTWSAAHLFSMARDGLLRRGRHACTHASERRT